jgi:hypothetical protein
MLMPSCHYVIIKGNSMMEFKTLALGALVGASITTSAIAPVMAQSPHPVVTPIVCDLCDGGFSRFASGPGGHFVTFGMTDTICDDTYVGARIDARTFPADSWSIDINSQGGDPFFVTELITPSREVIFTLDFTSQTTRNGKIHTTFDGRALGFGGDRFISIFVYDNADGYSGVSFTDTIDLSHGGIRVDGVFPIPNFHHSGVSDCTGIFGGGNSTI